MRLLALDLLAFGPFAGASLDLSARGGLDLVYGPNEAGKSTALRAIRGLFYGIDERTGDAHRHAMKDLRIGGRLLGLADRAHHHGAELGLLVAHDLRLRRQLPRSRPVPTRSARPRTAGGLPATGRSR